LTICDQSLIEEAFDFLERQKMSPSEYFASTNSTASTNKEMLDEGIVDTPNSPLRSLVDLIKKEAKDPEDKTPDSGVGIEDIVKSFLDSPSSNYYRPSEEPEPWDLTQLNIQASLISLNSKVKVLCGQGAEIESFRSSSHGVTRVHSVHIHNTTPLLSTLNNNNGNGGGGIGGVGQWRKSLRSAESPTMSTSAGQEVTSATTISVATNAMTAMSVSEHGDWSEELRSSVKKLRLALDGLLKTSRLAHSIFRLQERNDLGHVLKYRRDICFSHAVRSFSNM
jgi:inositol polyphosphate-4-phosphatase